MKQVLENFQFYRITRHGVSVIHTKKIGHTGQQAGRKVAMANSPKLAIAADRMMFAPNFGGLCGRR